MTNAKITKRALLASVLSVVMCISMLIGSTFAWFTDSATTGVNTITSGNLDMKVSYKNATQTTWKEVSTSDKLFNDAALWEPGYTEVAYLMVENKGNLALKYQLAVNVANEVTGKNKDGGDIKLSKVLKYDLIELTADTTYADRAAALAAVKDAKNLATETVTGNIEANTAAKYYALVVYMPTTVGNEANHDGNNVPSIQLGVNVYATQMASEEDSFGSDYDEKAEVDKIEIYKTQGYTVAQIANQSELDAAVANISNDDPTVIEFTEAGTYTLPTADMRYRNIVFASNVDAMFDFSTFNVNATQRTQFSTITFDGVDVKYNDDSFYLNGYTGLNVNGGKLIYKNCTISGAQYLYVPTAEFINCVFENSADSYSVCTYGAQNVTFTDCTFNTAGKAVLLYGDAPVNTNATFTNCVFNSDDSAATGKAAVETGDTGSASVFNITFTDCTANGFDANNSTSPLWGNKVNSNMPTDRLNVIINGAEVY